MATPEEIIAQLGEAVLDLLSMLDGRLHGMLRGTCEAVLAESQGGQVGPDGGFEHMQSLKNALTALSTRQQALEDALNRVASIDAGMAQRLRQMLSPLMNQSQQVTSVLEDTEEMATELARTNGNRLEGVFFGQGGLGPEVARDARALITTQMQQRASELMGRGIEPRLIPSLQSGGAQLMARIRDLPTNAADAIRNLVATLAAIRVLVQQAAIQAGRAGLAVLEDALLAIGAAIAEIGSTLVTLPIFINIDILLKKQEPTIA